MTRPHALSRTEIRRRLDRATKSVLLEYTGRSLKFHDRIYGYPDGTFLVIATEEMPYPPKLVALGEELGIAPGAVSVAAELKAAAVDALVAEAMVKAPQMLSEFAEPEVFWHVWDGRELERRHVVALARLVEMERLACGEMRLRSASRRSPAWVEPPPVIEATFEEAPAPVASPEPSPAPLVPPPEPSIVAKVEAAVSQARKVELPQRLPNGARRALQKLVRAQYVIRNADAPSVRSSVTEAMQDAESMAAGMRKSGGCDVEVTVIDWDGEWPVVVRRYGEGGRTIYRVEDALKRAGIDGEKAA